MVDKQEMLTGWQTSAQNLAGLLFLIEIRGGKGKTTTKKITNCQNKLKKGEIILITKGGFKNSSLLI